MKIANNYEMGNKPEELMNLIADGETVATYSVQDSSYTDDIYNGTWAECWEAAKAMIENGEEVIGIAKITLDADLGSRETIDFTDVEDIDFEDDD